MPAAFVVLAIYITQGFHLSATPDIQPVEWIKVVPYLIVLGTAISGVNVMLVLLLGILSTGIVGFFNGMGVFQWFAMGTGISGMGELIIITLLAGGMLEMIRYNGGIDFIINRLTGRITGKRGAELSIAALVSVANLCTANNTIAIITTGHCQGHRPPLPLGLPQNGKYIGYLLMPGARCHPLRRADVNRGRTGRNLPT